MMMEMEGDEEEGWRRNRWLHCYFERWRRIYEC
jgi:hypothetical protein